MQLSEAESIIAYTAAICTGGFFLWKAIAGWLVVNVEIAIELERQIEDEQNDLLAFKLVFKKGSTDTLQIKDIRARIKTESDIDVMQEFNFPEINKLHETENETMSWEEPDVKKRKISLSPGETFHVGRFARVPADKPVIIEAALHGTRSPFGWGFQWRASVASLPAIRKVEEERTTT